MYFEYIKEREGLDHFKNEKGFFTYEIRGSECYLANIFLRPEFRGTQAILELYENLFRVAKENSCNLVSANIYLNDHGFHRTIKCALKLGFSFVLAQNNCVTIVKNIGGSDGFSS